MIPFLIPSWTISVLALTFAYVLFKRVRQEKNMLLWGKIGTLVIIAAVYLLFSCDCFDIFAARVISRFMWVAYLLAELSYHYGKAKWNGIGKT